MTLQLLLLEGNQLDAIRVEATVLDGGIDCKLLRVETRADFVAALLSNKFDLILADYVLSGFDGIAALEIASKLCCNVPFIFVADSLGEELAIEALKKGATDYVLKQRLGRLIPSIQRALREAQERRERKRAELMLGEQNRLLELIASGQALDECLAAVCVSLSELSPRARACFLLTDSEGRRFPRSITPDFPPSFGQGLKDAPINDLCIGTCGEAVYRGQPITCADIANDERWLQEWRDLCVAHSVLACHSQPVMGVNGLPLGSLMLCFDEVWLPTDWEHQLAEFGTQVARIVFERDRSNFAMWESEAKYRKLFESLEEGFCICEMLFDKDGKPHDYRFVEVNPVFERLTGLQQATGKTARELLPNLEAFWFEIYGTVVQTGEPVRFEQQSLAMKCWFDVNAFSIKEAHNNQFAILFTNISDRKKIELERERFLAVGSDLQVITGINGYFQWVSPTFEQILGWTVDEMLSRPWTEFVHPDDIAASIAEADSLFLGNETLRFENRYRHKDGYYRWFLWNAKPDVEQQVLYGTAIDISDRKAIEAELRQKNAILDVINESVPTPIFVKDRLGRMIYANPATLSVLGKSAAEVIGYYDSDLYPNPEDAATVMENDQRIMESGQMEVVEESPDGIRTFLGMKVPYRNEVGEVIGLIGISNDISARIQLERSREQTLQQEQAARTAAEQANRIKDEFLAVLSHELRSPLNPILGWAKLLKTGNLDAARTAQAIATIERNAKLQSQLIEDLLDVSRILQGKLCLNVSLVNLAATIVEAIETVQLAAQTKSITIETNLDDIRQVVGDATRLQQIVWNLLSNAVKFTHVGGRVSVQLTQMHNQAQITISDIGKGIAPEFLPHVFDYFRQEDGATTRKFGGLGLGLAIVRHLVELHGGSVAAHSDGLDMGATFTVKLPLMPTQLSISRNPDTAKLFLDLSGVQVLVVDDEPDSREIIAFVLEQAGAKVRTAACGAEALAVLRQSQLDVVLSDIGMPDMDGYMLIRLVRTLPPKQNGQVKAIALTAYAGDFNQQQALQAGFQQHLAKPIEPNLLVKTIASVIESNAMRVRSSLFGTILSQGEQGGK